MNIDKLDSDFERLMQIKAAQILILDYCIPLALKHGFCRQDLYWVKLNHHHRDIRFSLTLTIKSSPIIIIIESTANELIDYSNGVNLRKIHRHLTKNLSAAKDTAFLRSAYSMVE